MPDIIMCSGETCPIKETCYRYKAIPNPYRQSFFIKIPYNFIKDKCKHFINLKKDESCKNRKTL